jgi:hypothetical protein
VPKLIRREGVDKHQFKTMFPEKSSEWPSALIDYYLRYQGIVPAGP